MGFVSKSLIKCSGLFSACCSHCGSRQLLGVGSPKSLYCLEQGALGKPQQLRQVYCGWACCGEHMGLSPHCVTLTVAGECVHPGELQQPPSTRDRCRSPHVWRGCSWPSYRHSSGRREVLGPAFSCVWQCPTYAQSRGIGPGQLRVRSPAGRTLGWVSVHRGAGCCVGVAAGAAPAGSCGRGERPAKRCHGGQGAEPWSRALAEQSSAQRALGLLHHHRSLLDPPR